MSWYLAVLKNYAGFSGRARRTEYWMFTLFNLIAYVVLEVLAKSVSSVFTILYLLYALAVIIPSLAVAFRRLHDIGKSAAWIWIALIPIVGGIWLLVLTCQPGQPGPNQYGPDPKAVDSGAAGAYAQ